MVDGIHRQHGTPQDVAAQVLHTGSQTGAPAGQGLLTPITPVEKTSTPVEKPDSTTTTSTSTSSTSTSTNVTSDGN
jgi:hypothetical protein